MRAGGIWRRTLGIDLAMIAKQNLLVKYPAPGVTGALPNDDNMALLSAGEFYIENIGDPNTAYYATSSGVTTVSPASGMASAEPASAAPRSSGARAATSAPQRCGSKCGKSESRLEPSSASPASTA